MLKGGLKGRSLNSGVEIVKKSSVGYSSVRVASWVAKKWRQAPGMDITENSLDIL